MVTTYLVTGASRGLGRALVGAYLNRPDSTVIAAVRNLSDPNTKSLNDLPKGSSSSLILVKIDSLSDTDAANAVSELQSKHNIQALDVVVANAGISKLQVRVEDAKPADMIEHYHANVVSVAVLFSAVLPLLQKSQHAPAKFVVMGSSAGTIGAMDKVPIPNAVYGPSKAALNWITRKVAFENDNLIAFPIHPGLVGTDMGSEAAVRLGIESWLITIEESVTGITKLIDNATKELTSGHFFQWDGSEVPW